MHGSLSFLLCLLIPVIFAEPPSQNSQAQAREYEVPSQTYGAPVSGPLSSTFTDNSYVGAPVQTFPSTTDTDFTYSTGSSYYSSPPLPQQNPGFSVGLGLDFGGIVNTVLRGIVIFYGLSLLLQIILKVKGTGINIFSNILGNLFNPNQKARALNIDPVVLDDISTFIFDAIDKYNEMKTE